MCASRCAELVSRWPEYTAADAERYSGAHLPEIRTSREMALGGEPSLFPLCAKLSLFSHVVF